MRRAAGVEPLLTSLPGAPPAHDIQGGGNPGGDRTHSGRVAGSIPAVGRPPEPPSDERAAGGPGLIPGGRETGQRVAPERESVRPPESGLARLAEHETRQGGRLHTRYPDPATPASDAFGRHFFRCFFCRIGARHNEDRFCEKGRELLVAMLDEVYEREYRR